MASRGRQVSELELPLDALAFQEDLGRGFHFLAPVFVKSMDHLKSLVGSTSGVDLH